MAHQFATGQHHLQAHHQIAHGAIAHHIHAARIASNVATDLARTFTGQTQRKQTPHRRRVLLHLLQHTACLYGHAVIGQIHFTHAVELGQRHDDAQARHALRWRGAATHAGIAALWRDGYAVFGAVLHGFLYGLDTVRLHHCPHLAFKALALVQTKARHFVGIDNQFMRREPLAQCLQMLFWVAHKRPVNPYWA